MVSVSEAKKRTQIYFERPCRGKKESLLQAKERREGPIIPGSLLQLEGIMFENFLHVFFNKLTE